jgi:hypothetical protein
MTTVSTINGKPHAQSALKENVLIKRTLNAAWATVIENLA